MKLSNYTKYPKIEAIYGILNTITNKFYIGTTYDLSDRFRRHMYGLNKGNHHSEILQKAFDKYGIDAFEVILFDLKCCVDTEVKYIDKFDSYKNGYNMTKDCRCFNKFKQSKKALENFRNSRRKPVISICRKTGEVDREFDSVSDAAIYYETSSSNISRVCKGVLNYIKDRVFVYKKDFNPLKDYKVEHHAKGRVITEEHRNNLIKSAPRKTKTFVYDLHANLLMEFTSMRQCELHLKLRREVLRKKIDSGTPFGGYLFYSNKL